MMFLFFFNLLFSETESKQNDWAFRRKFQKVPAASGSVEEQQTRRETAERLELQQTSRKNLCSVFFCIANAGATVVLSLFCSSAVCALADGFSDGGG